MRIMKNSSLAQASMNGETVLMSMDSERYVTLDEIASRVWTLVDEVPELEGLCARLREEYDVDAETCRREVEELAREWARLGLAELSE